MAPTPQEVPLCTQHSAAGSGTGLEGGLEAGNRVVISGMSGLYPNARHVKDLADILYNKTNPITSDDSRWVYSHLEMTGYTGKAPDLKYFDAQFFKVHYQLGINMDSMGRKILEQTHMAIYDAGINPEHLNGKKIGVYIGTSTSESEKVSMYMLKSKTGFSISGCSKSMFANRISYWLNAKGPSMSVDQACCSSNVALELAYQAILRGECEAAVVGGTSLCLHPQSLIHYGRLLKLSKDGKTKSFDENADGSTKSEAINVLFLQRAKDALRIYAEVVHVKSEFSSIFEDETGPRFGLYRNPTDIVDFLERFYKETNVSPQDVEYVEGCGCAIPEVDKAELEAYEKVFCSDRNTRNSLLVGSVMSNIGNGEAASGITGITKILLGYHMGVLAGNLHSERPRRDVAALRDGRMHVVSDHVPFSHGYTAVNSFSITGVNAHLLLKGYYKPKDPSRYKSTIPHLVLISGRQDSSVTKIVKDLKSRPVDPEEVALLNHAHCTRISGHLGRGFVILDTNIENETVSLYEKANYFDYVKRPLWFVYSGMGSQYNGMGADLMRIPVFAAAIEKCHGVLQPKGIDIVHIITSRDKNIFDNILHSFVGIAAIQIGLTDVLKELGIMPDKIIGHSVGELGCAYADGCFTAEEMILSAYSRGLISVQTSFIRGSMAAVGIGYQQILPMCPPEIVVACHNSPESCMVHGASGPVDVMLEFVASLVAKDIFAKEVPCSNIAYHSRYIADAGPGLLKYLGEVIKTPKARSERWVSTSVAIDKWNEPIAKYSSPEYHTNNLLNPVLFEEASRLIPPNAILVEIAPHGLLQSILKRSLPVSCTNIPLTRRGYKDNAVFLLEAVGKLYMEGLNPKIHVLYPKIEFPVSTGTPMLSHLVDWAHHEKWTLPLYLSATKKTAAAFKSIITLHDKENTYLQGHVIGGKILYPSAAILVAVWDTLAMTLGMARRRMPVQFRDVMLHVQPIMHERRQLRLGVTVHRGTGRFEVMDDMNSKVAAGFIKHEDNYSKILHEAIESQPANLTSKEIYDHFFSRGFSYKDNFKSIHSANLSLTEARIYWRGNWVTFIDGMLQLNNLKHSHGSYSHPNFIRQLIINPDEQYEYNDTLISATVLETHNLTSCGGVLMKNVKFNDLPMPIEDSTALKVLKFIPHFASDQFNFKTILQVYLQIVAENIGAKELNIIGIYNNQNALYKYTKIKNIMDDVFGVTKTYKWLKRDNIINEQKDNFSKINLVLICNLATDDHICQTLHRILEKNTFLINIRDYVQNLANVTRPCDLYQVFCKHNTDSSHVVELARWRPTTNTGPICVLSVNSPSDFGFISRKGESLLPHQKLLVITTDPAIPGLKDLLNKLKKKSGCNISLVMSNNYDKNIDDDALINISFAVRVIRNGVFGGEYNVSLEDVRSVKGNVTLQSPPGKLVSLEWVQASPQLKHGMAVKVHYAGLGDLDAKKLTGLIPFDTARQGYGMDFSGITESGIRVMGLVECGAVSSHVQANPNLLWPVPAHWSLEDAATVPFAYCLAYYCLTGSHKLYPGMRVLVHGGAGGLGQAVISLALANRCEIFATVSDIRKKQFLLKMYPGLKAENIGNSRDLTFCDLVLNATNGEGVDIIIATVKGEPKNVSLKCIAHSGTIIDVTQIPSRENFEYGMHNMTKSRSYTAINFFSIFNEQRNKMKDLQRMVSDGIARGWVRPLSRVTYAPGEVARGFRMLAASNQCGRVLLHLQQTDIDALCVQPRLHCSSEKLHVLISDHKGFGKQLVDMLISRGARKVCLNLPVMPEDLQLKIRQWESSGETQVCCKYTDLKDVSGLFDSANAVEGIYIAITEKQRSVLEADTIVETIDVISRKMFPDLKYFVVVNTVNSAGEETCISRNLDQFAATMIKLPELREVDDCNRSQEQISVREAVNIAERAISSEETVLTAHVVSTFPTSLLHQVAAIAEVNITQDITGATTLSDLGMDPTKANNVSAYLRDMHNVFLTVEEIHGLTAERIKDIDQTLTMVDFDNDKGLNKIFAYVDSDEIVASTEMVLMPTLTSSATWRDNNVDVSSTYLCIVPGLEGHYGRFRSLCEGLKLPALVLQPDVARPHETIPEMARRYAEKLSQTASPKKRFYLLGYESGVYVVLEMAAVLEKKGFSALVFCLGTPDEIKTEIKEHLNKLDTEEALQDAIIRHMFVKITNSRTDDLEIALQGVYSWQEKLNIAVHTLLGRVSHSAQYARQLIAAAYGRIVSLLQYELKIQALRSRIVLLQPTSAGVLQQTALQRYSQQPITVQQLRAPLSEAPDDLRCTAAINAHLDVDILEAFERKNLCETYALDGDAILASSLG